MSVESYSGHPITKRNLTTILAVLIMVVVNAECFAQDRQKNEITRSISTGVFTSEQAIRGEDLYRSHCQTCHHETLQGDGLLTPPVGGPAFVIRWSGSTLDSAMTFISSFMPLDEPGILDKQTYADLLAYILQFSGYPPGNTELPADPMLMQSIMVE